MGKSSEEIQKLFSISQETISFDAETDNHSYSNFVPDKKQNTVEQVEYRELQEKIEMLVSLIPNPRNRQVISLRYGLYDGYRYTLKEVQKIIGGITTERIRQIEKESLKILNKEAKKLGLDLI